MLLTLVNYITAIMVFFFALIGNASGIMLMSIFYYGFSILSITGIAASFFSTAEYNKFVGWCSMNIANVLSVTVNFSLALIFFNLGYDLLSALIFAMIIPIFVFMIGDVIRKSTTQS